MYQTNKGSLFFGLIPSLLFSCTGGARTNQITDRPNVIFVLVDDMGYGDLSCFGQKAFSTPELERMAMEGIRFNNFYCGTSVSAPSRASLLSGKHTGHTSVRGNAELQVTELYNIKTDPAETINVAGENPDLIKQFNRLFISARTEFKITPLFS